MHADHAIDDEFQPRESDAAMRNAGEIERAVRVAHVHHDLDGDLRQRVELDLFALELEQALVDVARVAFGAGDRDFLPLADGLGRIATANNGRDAELARDDRRVTGAAAAIGHDRRGALHDRLPVRIRHVSYEHVAGLHASHLAARRG